MNLQTPELDHRNWDYLVEEAKRRIAAKCPAWTDFNPSDPGMTLVELMAWMTDTVLYRLNRVPELNYIKFLELIGLRLQPARPARTWVFFEVRKDADENAIPLVEADTRISTQPQGTAEPVTFVTCRDLQLTTARIIKTCSRYIPVPTGGTVVNEVEEVHALEGDHAWETEIFHPAKSDPQRARAVPHILYLGDAALGDPLLVKHWNEMVLQVEVDVATPMSGQLFLEWEVWDGETWQTVVPENDSTQGFREKGTVRFERLPTMKERARAELSHGQLTGPSATTGPAVEPLWLRARLIGTEVVELPKLLGVRRQIDLKACVVAPEKAFAETPPVPPHTLPLQPLETNAAFQPLGAKAVPGSAFYLASELLKRHGATIAIQFGIRKGLQPQAANLLEIHWEYRHRSGEWRLLGLATPGAVIRSDFQLQDETEALTRGGKVRFTCPDDITPTELGGHSGCFIRARVERAEFANDRDALLIVHSVLLGFTQDRGLWAHQLSENYSRFAELPSNQPLSPFEIQSAQDPAFYVCLDKHPSPQRKPYQLFLEVVPQEINPWEPEIRRETDVTQRWIWRPDQSIVKPRGSRMIWEYRSPDGWKPLKIGTDGTEGFAHEGMVDFVSPEDWGKVPEFDQAGYWLRVRWEIAEFLKPPRLRRVLLNGVEVEQTSRHEWILGSSTQQPQQSFSLRTRILDRPEVWVRESDTASDDELAALQQHTGAKVEKHPDGCWVQWTEVRNFFRSNATDRHFTADLEQGTFSFGDGRNGMIPPKGRENIEAWSHVTLGAKGNVGSHTITVLEKTLEAVKGVKNIYPAVGGADTESIDKARLRGPWEIKHANRAVTREDFVTLAKKASPLVGVAECYEHQGTIYVIVVPNTVEEKPLPNRRLIEEVTAYLDQRRLINTRIKVQGPVYEAIEVEIEVVLETLSVSRLKEVQAEIDKKLRTFVHPLAGMDDGSGWPMGRTLHKSELYYLLENIQGVDHIGRLRLCRSGTGQWQDNIRIGDRSFPCFSKELKIQQSFG